MKTEAVILAAGLGTRMKSDIPKVLHPLGGRPMIAWTITASREATGRDPWVVIGPDADEVQLAAGEGIKFVEQKERLGTGHALMQSADQLRDRCDQVLVVHADLPLLRAESMRRLMEIQERNPGPLTLLVAHSGVSRGFGRILRDEDGRVVGIIEEAHASPEQLELQELNVGGYCYQADWLWDHLSELPLSPKGEYYLTDLVAMAVNEGGEVAVATVEDLDEVIGINTREHLAQAEFALRGRINRHWMLAGVSILDPSSTYIGPDVQLGRDTVLLPNTHLWGRTVIGTACHLGPNTIVRESVIGDRCKVEASVMEGATLESDVDVGPFAHLRKGAHLGQGTHMGNFGEVKNSTLGAGVRMGHFAYIGDATIGEGVNIGAGTVTCNYDGERKHRTEIDAGAFIGSDTMLVAPVRVGREARTGAGAVVNRDVPERGVAVGVPARVIRKVK
ncbi:MAG: bifunctional N-acetylglucosamine-1-phosphate uridyltransferase/glucosamine-1-phosphate acetyltransferase [Anaerolineae bacterium SM23_ 63]|nr:MAG: bifunctional N-acetylglucosamine-1-phosphate uridyltransferase/glucosamine-1-phosphate acetyltransferase [Anaerolineae bacterium SM23_ 63]